MKLKITKTKSSLFKKFHIKIFILLLICNYNTFSQNTHNIDGDDELEAFDFSTLGAGDTVILADGTYTSEDRLVINPTTGTSDSPITIKTATPGGVTFTNGMPMSIAGDYIIVDGFYWKGGYGTSNFIQFRNGYVFANHSTIQNCVIDGLGVENAELMEGLSPDDPEDTPAVVKHRWIVLYGTYNTVTNCSLMNKKTAGAMILAEYEYNAWEPPYNEPEDGEPNNGYQTVNNRCETVGHIITNNYFYNFEKILELYADYVVDGNLSNAGDSETIRIGTSEYQNVNSVATISNNYFVKADGENEIITNKSYGNKYTNNTFRRCRGSLVLRHGSDATVDGNYFLGENTEGTGGIRIVDSNHKITNNYIKDCINVDSQAQWNNGITFLGGGDNADVDCSSTGVSNGYQKVVDINVSNNTIINTNSPFYYNTAKGSNDPTGIIENNLIYFADGNSNLTDVITGDYNDLGTALSYTGNVYNGTSLGATNTGLSEDTGITAAADGEIFTFSGATGKGANMGTYAPTTDDMVGYGVGACFVDYSGTNILDGDCTIVIGETLTVSSLPTLTQVAASYDVSVTANVSWTATSNDNWITIDISSSSGNEKVVVTVTENTNTSSKTGTVTFTQDAGGDDIIRTLTVTQEAAARTNLINTGVSGDPVTIHSFSSDNSSKSEIATNTLDKDMSSVWTAEDGKVLDGDYKGDGEYVIYDLGDEYTLDFIQFNTTNKPDSFGIQILVSTTGTNVSDFSMVLPTSDGLLFTETGTTEFNEFEVDTDARYVKLIGYGRYNINRDNRESAWSAIGEIEFFGTLSTLSNDEFTLSELGVNLYPNPVNQGKLYIKRASNDFNTVNVFSVLGSKILQVQLNSNDLLEEIDLSSLNSGLYFVEISNGKEKAIKRILVTE
ncbi:chondroitinase-B domain-containing protein [Polaribacter sp. SA4-12]|uniref:chondroitinase-B domain-containing protein n=1 Tax=Polaribacter sp. SA4-12 TaxID=1312072 RepID=UPI000B3C7B7B|nr:chondroitinase-B domain-containing protein [Polaribacter sp. SA4-12]ARV16093.1 alginate lyase [Polaribacter sp. SA4-12]